MAKTKNFNALTMGSLDEISASRNISSLANTLKSYGLQPGIRLQRMLDKVSPGGKRALFVITLLLLIIIGYLSIKGAYFTSHVVGISIAISISSIAILCLCYFNAIKGNLKGFLLIVDIVLAGVNAIIFVPAAFNQDEIIAQQRTYMIEEKTIADAVLRDLSTYMQSGKQLHLLSSVIEKEESGQEGPVRKSAGMVASGTKSIDEKSIPSAGVVIPDSIMNMPVHSLADVKKMSEKAHTAIAMQLNSHISEANALKDNIDGWLNGVKTMQAENELSKGQEDNITRLLSMLDKMNSHELFDYAYTPDVVTEVTVHNKWKIAAGFLEFAVLCFMGFLIVLIRREEKYVNMNEAIAESQNIVIQKLIAKWNIEIGSEPIDTENFNVIAILEWLEKHPNTRTAMARHQVTFGEFVELYKKFGKDILEKVDKGQSHSQFKLHELDALSNASPDVWDQTIEEVSHDQWCLITKMVDDPEALLRIAKADTIFEIWGFTPIDAQLTVTDDMELIFAFLQSHTSEDLRHALKISKITMKQFIELYDIYGEDGLTEIVGNAADGYTLATLAAMLPESISMDIIRKIKPVDKILLEKYSLSVEQFTSLDADMMENIIKAIHALEKRIADDDIRTDYIGSVLGNVNVNDDHGIAAWVTLITKLRFDKVLLKVTPEVLSTMTPDAIHEFVSVVNLYDVAAGIHIMQMWKKEYSDSIAMWKTNSIFDIALEALLKKAPLAGTEASGLVALFEAYRKAEKQLDEMQKKDQKELEKRNASKVKPIEAEPKTAPEANHINGPVIIKLASAQEEEENEEEVAVAEMPAAEAEEEQLPERAIQLGIELDTVEEATDGRAILAVIKKTFTVI